MTGNISSLSEKKENQKKWIWIALIAISIIITYGVHYDSVETPLPYRVDKYYKPLKVKTINRWVVMSEQFWVVKLNVQEYLIVKYPPIISTSFGEALKIVDSLETKLKIEDQFRKGIILLQRKQNITSLPEGRNDYEDSNGRTD